MVSQPFGIGFESEHGDVEKFNQITFKCFTLLLWSPLTTIMSIFIFWYVATDISRGAFRTNPSVYCAYDGDKHNSVDVVAERCRNRNEISHDIGELLVHVQASKGKEGRRRYLQHPIAPLSAFNALVDFVPCTPHLTIFRREAWQVRSIAMLVGFGVSIRHVQRQSSPSFPQHIRLDRLVKLAVFRSLNHNSR